MEHPFSVQEFGLSHYARRLNQASSISRTDLAVINRPLSPLRMGAEGQASHGGRVCILPLNATHVWVQKQLEPCELQSHLVEEIHILGHCVSGTVQVCAHGIRIGLRSVVPLGTAKAATEATANPATATAVFMRMNPFIFFIANSALPHPMTPHRRPSAMRLDQ